MGKEKKAKKKKKDKDEEDDEDEEAEGGEDGEAKEKKAKKEKKEKKDKKEKKEKKEKKDKKEKKEKTKKKDKDDSDDDSGAEEEKDSDEEEQELAYDSELIQSVVNDITDFVRSKKDKLTVASMFEEVRAQQVTQDFDNKLRMYVVVSALFPGGSLEAKAVTSRSKYIEEFIKNGK